MAAEIKAKATLDSSNFTKGIERMKRSTSGLTNLLGAFRSRGSAVVAVIIAIGAILVKVAKSAIDFASKLSDMAYQTGVTVETFQRMEKAVRNAGGQSQHLVNTLARIRDAQGSVVRGEELMTKAFDEFGLSAEDVARMDIDELFLALAKSITDSNNSATKFSALVDLIGTRNAPKLLEAMNQLAEGSENVSGKLRTLSQRDAEALDLLADKWENFKNNIKTGTTTFVATVLRGLRVIKDADADARIASRERTKETARQARIEQLQTQRKKKEEERLAKEQEKRDEEREKALKRISDLEKRKEELRGTVSGAAGPSADRLAMMGGRFGGQVTGRFAIESRRLKLQQEINKINQKILDVQKQIEKNTAEPNGLAP